MGAGSSPASTSCLCSPLHWSGGRRALRCPDRSLEPNEQKSPRQRVTPCSAPRATCGSSLSTATLRPSHVVSVDRFRAGRCRLIPCNGLARGRIRAGQQKDRTEVASANRCNMGSRWSAVHPRRASLSPAAQRGPSRLRAPARLARSAIGDNRLLVMLGRVRLSPRNPIARRRKQ